ncbi:hypothetical protein KR044_011001 [Drosophila immigrans]|nr:hypothetical protein KR044_011001 [Drosophila immigrans]
MDTPTGSGRSSGRPTRTATPRLSERKRQLFRSRPSMLDQIDDDSDIEDPLLGLTPLKSRHQRDNCPANKHSNVRKLFPTANDSVVIIDSSSSLNSSPETNKENKRSLRTTRGSGAVTCTDEQLPHLFTATMCINSSSKNSHNSPRSSKTQGDISIDSDGDRKPVKRDHQTSADAMTSESSPYSDSTSPESKLFKAQKECIPTGAFYSHGTSRAAWRSAQCTTPSSRQQRNGTKKSSSRRSKNNSPPSRNSLGINKGVRHKIKKRPRTVPTVMDDILDTLRNEKLRQLITTKREERARVEEVHEILRSAKDPIQMAKPLSAITEGDANNNNNNNSNNPSVLDFSDFTDDEELNQTKASTASIDNEPVIPLIRPVDIQPPLTTSPKAADVENLSKRKFFKSGRRSSTCMEVRITDNIRASVNQGKIMLMEAPPPKKQRRVHVRSATIFSAEQATVDAILRNLDDTIVDEIVESTPAPTPAKPAAAESENTIPMQAEEPDPMQEVIIDPHFKYHSQLPYQTDDPAIMEQQALLLEFLISNNICTDKNFEIFIVDPDNHKDEATRIVDELYMVINEEMHELNEPASVQSTAQSEDKEGKSEMAQPATERESEVAEEPPGKLFPIFTQRLQPLPQKSTRRKFNATATRLSTAATGVGQYQIDAGQKAFGARQCQQCGLVYTVHEPEEEQLHREYHNAVHVLRFKGWIDEDIVAVYADWGADGRIIRITEQAPAARLQRLTELVKVVDKELGFSSYIVPKTFVAFFAVRKQQIIGLCLVQPLERANRFIQVDGIDYFSEETFESSCGVSRIWVSPLQRRRGIASLLLQAVQFHTVLGCEIARDKIAFSAPTDDGRALARHFTQNNNFLAYDQ